ncbi:alginate lyase family protein [Horticoccus luteus]|uniref:Alginate lyase family protein n=1 Tax=Horticoccus luteus TaxID=2862869 RepID=A0A8F9TVS0_9BACT|nr:alginate lyase family protein [Horticoccus luteus]QYM78972.1 alginate lyase family protein [Horticoccus luteus]
MPFVRFGFVPAFATGLLLVSSTLRAAEPYILDLAEHPTAKLEAACPKAIAAPVVTVVEKTRPSPTGDPHDYVSYGRYWWPDPTKVDGLPFIRRDGHHNREQLKFSDTERFNRMVNSVETLALGWAELHRADCATRAGDWLRAWFVTPATRMNPNFSYAQIRLGRDGNRGSSFGLIDGRAFIRVVDALRLLEGSPALSASDDRAVHQWFADYLQWFVTSAQGKAEAKAPNNHGSWYLQQRLVFNRYLGRDTEARKLAETDRARIAKQIKPDGRQPLELARADSLGYSAFNLEAQLGVALLAAQVGVDLWHYEAPNGGSLKKALDYLRPYNADPKTWTGEQLKQLEPGFLDPHLALVARIESTLAQRQ